MKGFYCDVFFSHIGKWLKNKKMLFSHNFSVFPAGTTRTSPVEARPEQIKTFLSVFIVHHPADFQFQDEDDKNLTVFIL